MLNVIGAKELLAKGVSDLAMLRPVLASNASPEERMSANATLRKDEWERIDTRVNTVMRERLTVVDDLRSRGLIEPVSLGTILRVTERVDDMTDAEISFDGDVAPQKDRPNFLRDVRPVPIISKDFDISWRQLEASRTRGEPLDVTSADLAGRKVRDQMQNLVANGLSTGGPAGGGIPGLTTAANRIIFNTMTDWDGATPDPVGDVEAMLALAYAKNLFGPFVLYICKNYWAAVQSDYTVGTNVSNRTVMERILAFRDIEAIQPLDALPDDNCVLVQMTRDVIDYSEAQAVTTVQWEKNPFLTHFRVLQVGGPHIKSIQLDDGTTVNGIVHGS